MAAIAKYSFYVYEILDDKELVIYIGKGSGSRKSTSLRHRNGSSAREVARFFNEEDAYQYEIERIAEVKPLLNKHIGGNGSRVGCHKGIRIDADTRLMSRIGTRAFAARMLLSYYLAYKYIKSKVDNKSREFLKIYSVDIESAFNSLNIPKLREVGYGSR